MNKIKNFLYSLIRIKIGNYSFFIKRNENNNQTGRYINTFGIEYNHKIYECRPNFENGFVKVNDIYILSEKSTYIDKVNLSISIKISKLREIFLKSMLNISSTKSQIWNIIEDSNLPNWFKNLKFYSLNTDPHLIKLLKCFYYSIKVKTILLFTIGTFIIYHYGF